MSTSPTLTDPISAKKAGSGVRFVVPIEMEPDAAAPREIPANRAFDLEARRVLVESMPVGERNANPRPAHTDVHRKGTARDGVDAVDSRREGGCGELAVDPKLVSSQRRGASGG
jgi:hypothetical protein